ncbi:MAG: ATP-dependent RecD-like DNA helicase [Eubacteriales bacterium]|nr:ATP-dependent RecD-like DNA helicase [Eubacteriales bacterium]
MGGEKEKGHIEGTVEEIIYANEINGYTVCLIDANGDPVTIVGVMPFLMEGEHIKAEGFWQLHPTFGKQFRVEVFEKELPENEDAVWRYLSSGAVKGIGPVTARRIIDRFGKETLSVLEKTPEWLSEIRGISSSRAVEIGESFAAQFGAREAMIFLNGFFGPSLSVKIYKKYRSAAPDIIKSNPYRLCGEISGIGFDKADQVASRLGFPHDSVERVEAGIRHVLMEAAYQSGHCYLPYEMLTDDCLKLLGVGVNNITEALSFCVQRGEIIKSRYENHEGYSLPSVFAAESYTASKLRLLDGNSLPFPPEGIESQIRLSEEKQGITYDEMQITAIKNAATCGLGIVTGGPGTGKTTVIKAIIDIFESLEIKYMLAAPTGRAAKRMSETSGRDAKTIHRMLEMVYSEDDNPVFSRNEDNPLPAKAFIIDETSMVDVFLMEAFLRAVKPDSMVIFIGDADQLPPVGPGNVLNDIISRGAFRVTRLMHIFRQAEKSLIIVNAHRINNGEEPYIKCRDGDFFFMERQDPAELQNLICSLCKDRLPAAYGYNNLDDIQVITPTKRGDCGTRELNRVLQATQNPPGKYKKEKKIRDIIFREGDKVMQVRNNYDLEWKKDGEEGAGVFNGDIGRIIRIDYKAETITVDFEGRICDYDFILADDLELAYAVTVHKAQGSEYSAVIIPMLRCPLPLMTRNLLYTAVTRAKSLLIAVGDPAVMNRMAANDKKDVRFTSLPYLLGRP